MNYLYLLIGLLILYILWENFNSKKVIDDSKIFFMKIK